MEAIALGKHTSHEDAIFRVPATQKDADRVQHV